MQQRLALSQVTSSKPLQDILKYAFSSSSSSSLPDQQDALKTERSKSFASRAFADPRPARTDQFEVRDQLRGLEEKFRVLNNDELADVLETRLVELTGSSNRWTPEVLSLLLHLSDKPVEKTNIYDLAATEPELQAPLLKWSDVLADDLLDDPDGIWDSIDYAADSSGDDEGLALEQSTTPDLTPDSSIQVEDVQADLDRNIQTVPADNTILNETINAQFWRNKAALDPLDESYSGQDGCQPPKVIITEAQMIREVIFMLHGLPTSIFTSSKDRKLEHSSRYAIRQVSQSSIEHLLSAFTTIGNRLSNIRSWTQRDEKVPVQQTFQAGLVSRMRDVNAALSAIEARILKPVEPMTISLLDLCNEISHITRFIQTISEVVGGLESIPNEQMPFKILEGLFERTCTCQSVGNTEGYEFMAQLFFECFETYLKPLRTWMETGELNKHDQVMFIAKNEEDASLDSIWQKQYFLRYDQDGSLYAPNFLHVAAMKIFTTGKSINFLKELGLEMKQNPSVFQLDYTTVCRKEDEDMLSPFSELLDKALDNWIASMHHSVSSILRNGLESQCGLSRSLDALEYIYFHRNGALSDVATSTIFDRIDRGNRTWNDGSILTERFRYVFGPLTCIDAGRLTIQSTASSYKDMKTRKRSMKTFGTLRATYTLPWPIANILRPSSIATYQRIFTFLLQTHRAKHLLQCQPYHSTIGSSWNHKSTYSTVTYSLRYRLLVFTNTLLTYLTEIVLSVSTAEMRAHMVRAEDVDAMIAVHHSYIKRLEEQCLISKRLAPIHQAIISLLDLAVLFTDTHAAYINPNHNPPQLPTRCMQRHQGNTSDEDSSSSSSRSDTDTDNDPATRTSTPSYEDQLRHMHDTFSKLHAFVTAGLRGVGRAGGEPCWEVLGEMLGVGWGGVGQGHV